MNKKTQRFSEIERLNKEVARLKEQLDLLALKDPLTGLYNHRYLEDAIEVEFARARRHGQTLSIIMIDIDYFKSINDVYGHPFGDMILKQFSDQIKRMVRRYDITVRYGGEEFVIMCPGADCAGTKSLAKRILDAINLYNFGNNETAVKLKLSLAVACYPDGKLTKGMDLIETADKILSRIKERGGNMVYAEEDLDKRRKESLKKKDEGPEVKALKGRIDKLTKRANESLLEAIFAFAKTIELKDHYTGSHVERSVHYAEEIAREMRLPKDEVENIKVASILHDLGKIGISEKILHKRAKLTQEEFDTIKRHPQIAIDIIRPIHALHDIMPLILHHHEKWNGEGYPHGLKAHEIPIGARIIAVADVYQALITDRPYRKKFPKEEAINIIKKESGSHFDPKIVAAFLKIIGRQK